MWVEMAEPAGRREARGRPAEESLGAAGLEPRREALRAARGVKREAQRRAGVREVLEAAAA